MGKNAGRYGIGRLNLRSLPLSAAARVERSDAESVDFSQHILIRKAYVNKLATAAWRFGRVGEKGEAL
jgi:hypothetical protein